LQNAEHKLCRLVELWHGNKSAVEKDYVKYPETFDVRSLFDEFTVAEKLLLVEAPEMLRREQMKQIVDKLFPRLAKSLKDEMLAEMNDWPVNPVDRAEDLAKVAAKHMPTKQPASGSSKPPASKRQGQVVKKTS
jgi:hypothetical protein